MNDKQNQIDKIRKLFALAANPGASEGEADNATRMATKLMLKYEISEHELSGGGEIKCGFAFARHMNIELVKAPMYAQFVAVGVAEFLGCIAKLINNRIEGDKQSQVFKFGGAVQDVKFAVWLCETMCLQGLREWRAYQGEEPKVRWMNGWGCAVQERLKRMSRVKKETEAEAKASDSTALIVLDQKVALVKEKFGDGEYKKNENVKLGNDGWQAGQKTAIPTGALETTAQHKALAQ